MLMLDRRTLLRAGSAAVGAAALAPTAPALAYAPQAGKRAQPSFYRFKLGTIEITVVSDGTLALQTDAVGGPNHRFKEIRQIHDFDSLARSVPASVGQALRHA